MWSGSLVDRVRESAVSEDRGIVPSLPALEDSHLAVPLESLVERARASSGVVGEETVRELNAALRTLLPTEANGHALIRILDAEQLGGLEDESGTSSRAIAIEALLRLGYPWALRVRPEDLQWYRDTLAAANRKRWYIALSLLSVAAGALVYFTYFF
jgi:hypothetical protein